VITKLGSICAHAGEASSHLTPENIFSNFCILCIFWTVCS